MLVLLIGDLHIPHRAHSIPANFRKLLMPNKMQHVLCTGNLCTREMLDYLRSLTADVHVVRGDFDDDSVLMKNPDTKVVRVGQFRIGLIHGHQLVPWNSDRCLSQLAVQLDVDVMVCGHSHKSSTRTDDAGILYLNPGSASGAHSSTGNDDVVPSFMLLDVQSDVISVYIYTLVEENVKVERVMHKKKIV